MSLSHINGIALSGLSNLNGIAKSGLSEVNGQSLATSNGLLTGLQSYWKLDEASGNALDAHGSNALTNNNSVGTTTGLLNGCRTFASASLRYFSLADNASISTGDVSFAFAGWVYQTAATSQVIVSKWQNDGTNREYLLDTGGNSGTQFRFIVYSDGSTSASVVASNFGNIPLNTWCFVIAWHDATANTINLQVNNGTVNSTAHSAGVLDTTTPFQIGARRSSGGNAENHLDGRLDEFAFWKGSVPDSTQRTLLYGSGTPPGYSSFS